MSTQPSNSSFPAFDPACLTPQVLDFLRARHYPAFTEIIDGMASDADQCGHLVAALDAGLDIELLQETRDRMQQHPAGEEYLARKLLEASSHEEKSSIDELVACIARGDEMAFQFAIKRCDPMEMMHERSALSPSFKLAKLFDITAPKSQVKMSTYAMVLSAMMQAKMHPSSTLTRRWMDFLHEHRGPVDPLSTAFVFKNARVEKSFTNLELSIVNRTMIEPLLSSARKAGMLKGRPKTMLDIIDRSVATLISAEKFDNESHAHLCRKVLSLCSHGLVPEKETLQRVTKMPGEHRYVLIHQMVMDSKESPRPLGMAFKLSHGKYQVDHTKALPETGLGDVHCVSIISGAILSDRKRAVKNLILAGLDVSESSSENGITALHAAALVHDVESARHLILAGADIDAPDAAGRKPADWADHYKLLQSKQPNNRANFDAMMNSFRAEREIEKVMKIAAGGSPLRMGAA